MTGVSNDADFFWRVKSQEPRRFLAVHHAGKMLQIQEFLFGIIHNDYSLLMADILFPNELQYFLHFMLKTIFGILQNTDMAKMRQ